MGIFCSSILEDHDKQCLKDDKEIWLLLTEHHLKLCESTLKVNQGLNAAFFSRIFTFPEGFPDNIGEYFTVAPQDEARFFVALRNHLRLINVDLEPISSILDDLDRLLKYNLKFDMSRYRTGEGPHKFVFLDAEITDEKLPWDTTQVDWREAHYQQDVAEVQKLSSLPPAAKVQAAFSILARVTHPGNSSNLLARNTFWSIP